LLDYFWFDPTRMPGIYIHIPFCHQACSYCDFHFSTQVKAKNDLVGALAREIHLRRNYLKGKPLTTIYFGGGTPSIIGVDQIKELLRAIADNHAIEINPEVTLEANPEDLTSEKAEALIAAGVNRLSIGIQSFRDEDLRLMNRSHDAKHAVQSVRNAQAAGFKNISVDLIYGVPGLSDDDWKKNMEQVFALDVQHLSCYSLTIEPRTAFAKWIKEGQMRSPDEEQSSTQFELLMDHAPVAGFEHYEISNFAKPGFLSRHNTSYWLGEPYVGIGPSAHSYDIHSRQWNISNNASYIQSIAEGKVPLEREELTRSDKFNEMILTSLRTAWGIYEKRILENFGEERAEEFSRKADVWMQKGMLELRDKHYVLTRSGKHFADRIAGDFFILLNKNNS